MANNSGTLEAIGRALGCLLSPLEESLSEDQVLQLMAELGMLFPAELQAKAGFNNALNDAATSASLIPPAITALAMAINAANLGDIVSNGINLINYSKNVISDINEISNQLNSAAPLAGINSADLITFANELPVTLIDYLVIKKIEAIPGLAETLEFIGAINRNNITSGTLSFVRRKIELANFIQFLQKPGDQLKNMYGWGASNFDGIDLLKKFEKFLTANNFPAILDTSSGLPVLDVLFVEITPKIDINPKGILISISEPIKLNNSAPYVQNDFTVALLFNGPFTPGDKIVILPNGKVSYKSTSQLNQEASLKFTAGTLDGQSFLLLGQAGASMLEAKQLIIEASVGLVWDSTNSESSGNINFSAGIKGGKFSLDFSQGDGFLTRVLSGLNVENYFDVDIDYSSERGFIFRGSDSLNIKLPQHISLGPVEINALYLLIGIENGKFPIGIGMDITASLGPLTAVIENIGIAVDFSFPPNHKGNLGPIDFELAFLPPTGLSLSIDAGPVSGGGYISFDPDKGEYSGIIDISLFDIVTVKGYTIIDTKMPDGSDGFSLLIILTAEFGSGIQLGFGFTLLGVGGLFGLNRTMLPSAIAAGIQTGDINGIMFPSDPLSNATRIISDMGTYFPAQEGVFLIGPLAKFGWGTPTLISLSMGIIIQVPGDVAIIGVLRIAIPDPDIPLIVINVGFIGAIEYDKSRMWFYAAMFDSHILFLNMSGSMGLLMDYSDNPNFVLSVGGFNPNFNPPPLPFPALTRIEISVLSGYLESITVTAYFAVTSNTVQFGAAAQLLFGFSECNLNGHFSFDALFQFSPFHFIVQMSFSVSLSVFGFGLFSVNLSLSLQGVAPWQAAGTATLTIDLWLFDIDISASFNVSWGQANNPTLPPVQVIPILIAEFNKSDNWRTKLPDTSHLMVSLRKLDPATQAKVLHPLGTIEVRQRAVPLGVEIDKVGNCLAADAHYFSVVVDAGINLEVVAPATDEFAMAQYRNLTDAQKLSIPAFHLQNSGVELAVSGQQVGSSKAVKRVLRYNVHILDNAYQHLIQEKFSHIAGLFPHFLNGNAASKSLLSQAVLRAKVPTLPADRIMVNESSYSVAALMNNAIIDPAATFTSQLKAQDYMQSKISDNPQLAGQLHVISSFEAIAI